MTANGAQAPKVNSAAMLYAAKKNDYERVKLLFRYGYRLERMEKITDPLKRIELVKRFIPIEVTKQALTSWCLIEYTQLSMVYYYHSIELKQQSSSVKHNDTIL